jgi:hypothetical protein
MDSSHKGLIAGSSLRFIQPVAVKQDGTPVATVEKREGSFLQKPPAPAFLTPDERIPLIKQVVEPTFERELKHEGAATGEGSYSATLLTFAKISPA